MLVFGDWGIIPEEVQKEKNYIPILPSLMKTVNESESINLLLFLGDLAYDFAGEKYKEMLVYMQAITSIMCFMTSAGNHDNVYHLDTAELFTETFLSPKWSQFYNYFYLMKVGKVLFLNYVPENIVDGDKQEVDVRPIEWM